MLTFLTSSGGLTSASRIFTDSLTQTFARFSSCKASLAKYSVKADCTVCTKHFYPKSVHVVRRFICSLLL